MEKKINIRVDILWHGEVTSYEYYESIETGCSRRT